MRGFKTLHHEHCANLEVLHYSTVDEFGVRLRLKQPGDELTLLRTKRSMKAHEIAEIACRPFLPTDMRSDDVFAMPALNLQI